MKIIPNDICYLCNEGGADTRDHVPLKCLFDSKDTNQQRLTLPAHKTCNNEFSKYEEYFRDVIIQQAMAFGLSDVEEIKNKVWRSWSKGGYKRYQELIKTAKPAYLQSTKSSIVKNVITIDADQKVLKRVAIKTARGVIYNDTGCYTKQTDFNATYIPTNLVPELKEKDKEELFWRIMSQDSCLHTFYGPNCAARRHYLIYGTKYNLRVMCMLGLILVSAFYVTFVEIPFENVKNMELKYIDIYAKS